MSLPKNGPTLPYANQMVGTFVCLIHINVIARQTWNKRSNMHIKKNENGIEVNAYRMMNITCNNSVTQ